jgi:hypothetical protein
MPIESPNAHDFVFRCALALLPIFEVATEGEPTCAGANGRTIESRPAVATAWKGRAAHFDEIEVFDLYYALMQRRDVLSRKTLACLGSRLIQEYAKAQIMATSSEAPAAGNGAGAAAVADSRSPEGTPDRTSDTPDGSRHEGDETPEIVTVAASKQVQLFGPSNRPRVRGKNKPVLTKAQFDVVLTLIGAGESGLTKDRLDEDSKHGDARRILKRLADSDPDWQAAIQFPGRGGMGKHYRIL